MKKAAVVVVLAFCTLLRAAGENQAVPDSAAVPAPGAVPAAVSTEQSGSTPDAISALPVTPTPQCTIVVSTEPSGVVVKIDGRQSGTTPLVISGISPGNHTLILQKTGFYQKKAVIDLPAGRSTSLHFQLSAPGRLTVASEPGGAVVTINGRERGVTPFIDSLVKPGTYTVAMRKDHCNLIEDSIMVASGGRSAFKGVLTFTDAYRDSLQRRDAAAKVRRNRISTGVIGGVFALFLITLASIESQE